MSNELAWRGFAKPFGFGACLATRKMNHKKTLIRKGTYHGFTLLIYIVSISSSVLPCVSQTKKYTISTAAKLHDAKTYPYLNPISLMMNGVKKAIRKFHVQLEDVTNAILRAR